MAGIAKRALLVGIDEYESHRWPRLRGCCNDVRALKPLLSRNEDKDGSRNFGCITLLSDELDVNRDTLLADVDRLLAPAADVALFYFAGHGRQEKSDVTLITSDATPGTAGIPFSELLAKVQSSPVPEVVIILDCCFSGGAGGVPQLGSASATIRSGVSILTASRADQSAEEKADPEALTRRGVFSTYLEGALEGGAADVLGTVTVAGVYAYVSELFGPFDQRPTFKANIDRLHPLRLTTPSMETTDLRRMAGLFAEERDILPLDWSYEPELEPRHPEHEAYFALLQRGRAAKLIEPVGAEHMYWAAYYKQGCRLTPLGRHYWQLVSQGIL